ncbi:sensor histidine kinase [Rhodococcoides corynebacterioides]|uniref:Sensor histidine kinase n=1 Tax=Rhodococcoides corynebacterioides TaxID=53972 RepID=A0ABS7P5X4_9NOCA|nr:histidine kinase [Rhodococcus corynebacterioides]MBY6367267.1 sensor histidine kinase [Rhodococcus corynebacterioides]MBY6408810.1 sensor histidine kinase [Rhodococcus corynebacterioides]
MTDIVATLTGREVEQRQRRGWLFGAIWLAFLVYPLGRILQYPGPWSWTVAGCVSLALFAVAFLVGFREFRRRLHDDDRRPEQTRRAWATLVLLTALLVPVVPAAGDSVLTGSVYLAVFGIITLPGRTGVAVVAVVAAAVEILPRVVDGWTPDNSAAITVVAAAMAAWGVKTLIQRNAQLLEVRRRLADLAVVEERERLARDVHDILGHSLTVVTVKAELAGRLIEHDPRRASAEIADIEALARQALADVRSTVGGFRHLRLDEELLGARSALDAAAIELRRHGNVDDVPEDRRELFARVLREAVTNVVRHSGASTCTVDLGRERITVEDDGVGPGAGGQGATGSGLSGLADLVRDAGGTLTIARGTRGGFRVTAEVRA